MSLNIKNPQTHDLVKRLASATGLTQTAAVHLAVANQLERVERSATAQSADSRIQGITAAAQRWRDRVGRDVIPDTDALYDENGLPR
ncbi:MAG: type II toxin-antitoxin system VapB family antitoxin [Bifidobacteriaceae bacterium]|jgi:antitoxin VapB|nr:type II toxin-antitoxin system VapB family antitoxin [Bifidobacteriaceae bacterium]